MDSVKNKMEALIKEKQEACLHALELEGITKALNAECEDFTKTIHKYEREISKDEEQLDSVLTMTQEALERLDVQEKTTADAEQNLAALIRKVQLLEEESTRVNDRLRDVLGRLESVENEYEENERARKILDAQCLDGEEHLEIQAAQLEEATILAEEADRKFEEMSRKLRMVETDNERVNDRADDFERKCQVFEDGIQENNKRLQELEKITQKNSLAEDEYETEVSNLRNSLSTVEDSADFSERTVEKLEKTVDELDSSLYKEKFLYQQLSLKIDSMLTDMTDMADIQGLAGANSGAKAASGDEEEEDE